MPHIAVTMYPGRDDERKRVLSKNLRDCLAETLAIDPSWISVSVEDVPEERWADNLARHPADTMFIPPQ